MTYSHSHAVGGLTLLASLLSALAGCGERPADPDELVLYLKNARVHGKVRMLWPEGQAYVDHVLKADHEFRASLKPLLALRSPEVVWAVDAKHWGDRAKVEMALQETSALLSPAAADQRIEKFEALDDALSNPPAGVDPGAVWEALSLNGEDLRQLVVSLTQLAHLRLELLRLVQVNADKLDANGTGLRFTDPDVQAQAEAAHAALAQAVDTYERQYRDFVQASFDHAEKQLTDARDAKTALKSGPEASTAAAELKAIEDRIDYQMARREFYERELKRLKS